MEANGVFMRARSLGPLNDINILLVRIFISQEKYTNVFKDITFSTSGGTRKNFRRRRAGDQLWNAVRMMYCVTTPFCVCGEGV